MVVNWLCRNNSDITVKALGMAFVFEALVKGMSKESSGSYLIFYIRKIIGNTTNITTATATTNNNNTNTTTTNKYIFFFKSHSHKLLILNFWIRKT